MRRTGEQVQGLVLLAAPVLHGAAQTARQVTCLLFVPASVSGVFRLLAPEHGLMRLLTIVAALCMLVGVARFFFLLGGLRQRMADAVAPPSQVSIFPSA